MAVAAIDCDVILYRAAWAAQTSTYEWVHEKTGTSFGEFPDARSAKEWYEAQGKPKGLVRVTHTHTQLPHVVREIIHSMMSGIIRDVGADDYYAVLSGNRCWRHDIATTKEYKGNRGDKPILYMEAKRFLIQDWGATIAEGMEADDALAMEAADCERYGRPCVICSVDKDLLTIPGQHYNFVTGEWHMVGVVDGYRRLMKQVLMGDSVDNVPGLPRVGDRNRLVLALDEMEDPKEMAMHVIQAYQSKMKDKWKEYLWEQANLVYIRTQPGLYLNEWLRPVQVDWDPKHPLWEWPGDEL